VQCWRAWAQQQTMLAAVLAEFVSCVADSLASLHGANDARASSTAFKHGMGLLESTQYWDKKEDIPVAHLPFLVVDLVRLMVVAFTSSNNPARSCLTQAALTSVSVQQAQLRAAGAAPIAAAQAAELLLPCQSCCRWKQIRSSCLLQGSLLSFVWMHSGWQGSSKCAGRGVLPAAAAVFADKPALNLRHVCVSPRAKAE
jgi:hypothetical protein